MIIEMICWTRCIVGLGLLGASIATMLVSKQHRIFQEYERSLNQEQRVILNDITDMRLNIYFQGLAFGLVLATVYLMNVKTNNWEHACVFLAIALGVNYLWYILSPKRNWMIPHLKTPEQLTNWTRVYRMMQYRWHLGFVLGGIGAFILSWGIIQKNGC